MALTVSNIDAFSDDVFGRHRVRLVEAAFDASYPTGGEAFTPAVVGLADISLVVPSVDASGDDYRVTYDYSAEKLVVHGVEQDADGATTDPFDEVDDTTDLSGLVVRVLVIGH